MARKVILSLVDSTGPQQTAMEDIPKDVVDFVEAVYEKQRRNPGRERVAYDSIDELKKDYKLMCDYVAQRPKSKPGGILKIRRSPTRDLPDNTMDLRITSDIEANGNANGNADPNAATTQKAAAK